MNLRGDDPSTDSASATVPADEVAADSPSAPGTIAPAVVPYEPVVESTETDSQLLRALWVLAWPVLAEHVLHMMVGLNDTYIANHVTTITESMSAGEVTAARSQMAAAAAAVGTISYLLWFVGLIVGAIGTGSTAIIARATGAKHRSLANSICGQSIAAAAIAGVVLCILMYAFAKPIAGVTGLTGQAYDFALMYVKMLSFSLPFLTTMFVANACLRGAGDTLSPAITFVVVDGVNLFFSWGLTYGAFGLPKWGFEGIAAGTVLAYITGGAIQTLVLVRGRGGVRLHLHRLQPHWHHLKRLLRIGVPSGLEGLLQWGVNFALIVVVNRMDASNVSAAAHNNTVKIEGISYLAGFAFATAAATFVGQSLGMKNPRRATRGAYLAFALGGGLMTLLGAFFIFAGQYPSMLLSDDPQVRDLTTRCLFITGFCQFGFAAGMIFGGALRGAGDTLKVMLLTLISQVLIRLAGVLLVGLVWKQGLAAVWIVLTVELVVRGALVYGRFINGGWKKISV